MSDLIERWAVIELLSDRRCNTNCFDESGQKIYEELSKAIEDVKDLPSTQSEWNNHTVACLLAELFDDTCACNYNDIDEWLPEKCELLDSCPHTDGVACWEQFLKHKAERRADE